MGKFLSRLSIFLLLTSCAIYKVDVQQGNVVTQEMLDQLVIGMPASKVKFIMGSPLIVDAFRKNRWDYLYSFQAGGGQRQQRRITLFFDDQNKLLQVDGDVMVSLRYQLSPPPSIPEQQSPAL